MFLFSFCFVFFSFPFPFLYLSLVGWGGRVRLQKLVGRRRVALRQDVLENAVRLSPPPPHRVVPRKNGPSVVLRLFELLEGRLHHFGVDHTTPERTGRRGRQAPTSSGGPWPRRCGHKWCRVFCSSCFTDFSSSSLRLWTTCSLRIN